MIYFTDQIFPIWTLGDFSGWLLYPFEMYSVFYLFSALSSSWHYKMLGSSYIFPITVLESAVAQKSTDPFIGDWNLESNILVQNVLISLGL